MTKILACIDGSTYSKSVADHAAWAAGRLGASVELLQVLGRREVSSDDRSGRIVAGGRRRLLEQLAELDAERAKVMHEKGWLELDEARKAIGEQGVMNVTTSLRHGDLIATLEEREAEADLVVVGKRGEAANFATMHLGSNLERILRSTQRTVLVTARAFKPIEKAMIAFDGHSSALKAIEAVSQSALFEGVSITVLTVGRETAKVRRNIDSAADHLRSAGLSVTTQVEAGEADDVIPTIVEAAGIDLLVMGAYGHSRLRTMVIGSTTSAVIRSCLIPILVCR